MNKKALEDAFNKIWESTITGIDTDLLRHSITFKLKLLPEYNERLIELVFEGVSAYHFFNNTIKRRKQFHEYEIGNFLELTTIDLIESECSIQLNGDEEWYEHFGGSANVYIEICTRLLLIEATKVIIDGQVFELV